MKALTAGNKKKPFISDSVLKFVGVFSIAIGREGTIEK